MNTTEQEQLDAAMEIKFISRRVIAISEMFLTGSEDWATIEDLGGSATFRIINAGLESTAHRAANVFIALVSRDSRVCLSSKFHELARDYAQREIDKIARLAGGVAQ